MKKVIIICAFFPLIGIAQSQQQNIDYLLQQIEYNKTMDNYIQNGSVKTYFTPAYYNTPAYSMPYNYNNNNNYNMPQLYMPSFNVSQPANIYPNNNYQRVDIYNHNDIYQK